jgi:hypothetical protein
MALALVIRMASKGRPGRGLAGRLDRRQRRDQRVVTERAQPLGRAGRPHERPRHKDPHG